MLIWKVFQNKEEWLFSFWNTFFRFRDTWIDVFLNQESDDIRRFAFKMVKYWIKTISGNIEAVLFKLGTRNVPQNLLCCCHENGFASGPVLIETQITSFCINPAPSTPANVRQYGNHVCSKHDPLSHFEGLKMRIFGF